MDLSNLSTQQLAVLGIAVTFIAAFVGFVASLVAALVGAWNDRIVSREQALREYKWNLLREFLTSVDRSTSLLRKLGLAVNAHDAQRALELWGQLQENSTAVQSTGFTSLFLGRPVVSPIVRDFLSTHNGALENAFAALKHLQQQSLTPCALDLESDAAAVFDRAVNVRLAIEDFMFQKSTHRQFLEAEMRRSRGLVPD